jgi:uncharacterized protein
MLRSLPRLLVCLLLLLPGGSLVAEKVAHLPLPTAYVNDFAQVLTPDAHRNIEDLCTKVHQQAQAELVVVTVKTLDGLSIEEFTSALEEKWKIGKKGDDRGALVVLSLDPRRLRVETGYGLEGILPDSRVGAILDAAAPFAHSGDYDQALLTTVQGLADVIAADKGVTLTPSMSGNADVHYYHREPAPRGIGVGQIILGIGFVILIVVLIMTGHIGWAFYLILNLMGGGGGRRGGGGGGDDWGGGFGGSGGGSSGGGGASTDF